MKWTALLIVTMSTADLPKRPTRPGVSASEPTNQLVAVDALRRLAASRAVSQHVSLRVDAKNVPDVRGQRDRQLPCSTAQVHNQPIRIDLKPVHEERQRVRPEAPSEARVVVGDITSEGHPSGDSSFISGADPDERDTMVVRSSRDDRGVALVRRRRDPGNPVGARG